MKARKTWTVLLAGALSLSSAQAQQLAFPEAQGWGRFAQGARAVASPTVYHVTNLNDSGTGSLRDAVSQGGRIVVFDVSGVIRINSRITFAPNIYVAGQTAPGEGITVYGDGVSFSNASNIICRYLRVRMGHGGSSGKDCAGIASGTNMIFDHCSFSWGLDETFSINPDGKGAIGDITIQNTIVGQGLMTHSAGGLMQADNITLYRNFYCDNSTRNNKVKGKNQYANNIVYNWKNGAYIMGGDSEGKSYANIQSNLFINGPAGGGDAFTGANADFHCYGIDNWQDSDCNGKYNPFEVTNYSASTREPKPYDYPDLPLWSGKELLEKSLPTVGASLPYRDQADCYMVDEVLTYGAEGALITYETALPIGSPDTWSWWKGTAIQDTDKDGMPDWWENANGTNPNSNDACKKAANGYLNIENYINSISADNRQLFLRKPITPSLKASTTSTMTIAWRDYTYAEDGFEVEVSTADGSFSNTYTAGANATQCVVSGLEPGTSYKVRIRAFGTLAEAQEITYSDYSDLCTFSTRPLEVGMVDIDTYEPDVTNSTDVAEGQKLLLTAAEGETFDFILPSDIAPASVVATGKGIVNISGAAITGATTSVNKDGEGTLVLNGKNTYKGATVTHGGTIEFNSIANAEVASALGASMSFAQNWIFDGGTFRYTGGNASSNRNARIDRASTLSIDKSSTTLTMTGIFEGEGSLTLDGKGTLSIANADFIGYNGATRLKGGKLYMSDTENACKAFGESGKKVIMAGGCLQFASKNEDYQNLNFPIEVEDGTHSILSMPTHCYFKSPITGNGTLQFDLPYVRAYLRPDLSGFTGKLIGNATKGGALFYNETQWNAPQVRFELKNGITLSSWASTAVNVLGGLSGDAGTFLAGTSKQNKGFTCTWEVGSANSDETFRGVINNLPAGGNSAYSGTTSIKKVGTGEWRLTGNNVYSGATTVSAGTLIVNGNHSGAGAVSVASGATLKGSGSLAGKVTISKDATLCAGDTLVNGSSLGIKGGLTMNAGSALIIPLATDKDGKLTMNSIAAEGRITVTKGAVLELDMTRVDSEYAFKRGDALPVFKNASNITGASGSFDIVPATPGEGLEWETSTLLVDGMLRVKNEGEEYQGGAITTQNYTATLDHTASVQGGSNEAAKYLDLAEHYYNNWGTTAWVAQAYAQFSFAIPENEEITKAEFTVNVNCARGTRTFDICYLPAGSSRIDSKSDIPNLCAKTGTQLATYSDITTSYQKKTVDVTEAVKQMQAAGQNYIVFVMSNGAAGGNIYGKGNKANAPTLTIRTLYNPSVSVIDVNEHVSDTVLYDLSGRAISDAQAKKGIYIHNGKKIIK